MDSLLNVELTFGEVEKISAEKKMLQCTKEAYLREVECGTWNEAIEALPDYSREDILTQYRVQKGKKTARQILGDVKYQRQAVFCT